MYNYSHYSDFITTTIVCIQSDIFHKSFSLRVNKSVIQFLFRIILSFDPINILLCNVLSCKRNGSMVYGLGFLGPLGSPRVLGPCFSVCLLVYSLKINNLVTKYIQC